MASLPIIDFSPFLNPESTAATKRSTALEIDRACREVGFFYLLNHGIDANLIQEILANAKTFFESATAEEKEKISIKKPGDGIGDLARGFQRVDGGPKGSHEAVDLFRPVDNSQGPPYEIGFGENQWPETPASFRQIAEKYIDAVLSLAMEVMKAISIGLGVDETEILSRVNESFWDLRILGYEATTPKTESAAVSGIGDHTDFGILTFLLTDSQEGSLQVLSKTGEWIPADPIPGCYVVNLGDMLSKWTNGLYVSTRHRVIHNSPEPRISIPLFFDPNMDALISPLLPLDGSSREDKGVFYREKFVQAMEEPIVYNHSEV